MFIRVVDEGLEAMLRARLPLPEELGDISFETPNSGWAAKLSRITVNLFLYDVSRSSHPNRAPIRRVDANGKAERRPPQPMVELSYLVSAWAGTTRDEHQLLGDVIGRIAGLDVLPPEYLATSLSSSVFLAFVEDERHRNRDIWNGAGGTLKASFAMTITVAADSFDWIAEPTAVTSIQGMASPRAEAAKP